MTELSKYEKLTFFSSSLLEQLLSSLSVVLPSVLQHHLSGLLHLQKLQHGTPLRPSLPSPVQKETSKVTVYVTPQGFDPHNATCGVHCS
ncbi:hypothetical protein Sjap_021387 [Stephania japonica]|uniref:Uncharacterized protein n=1 Tax=Stephania japonica TaxID=461633 RepID=A0AAP0ELV9_9MAGN